MEVRKVLCIVRNVRSQMRAPSGFALFPRNRAQGLGFNRRGPYSNPAGEGVEKPRALLPLTSSKAEMYTLHPPAKSSLQQSCKVEKGRGFLNHPAWAYSLLRSLMVWGVSTRDF